MTVNDLIIKAMTKGIVERSNSPTVEVECYPRGGAKVTLNLLPEYGEWEKDEKDGIVSNVVFHLSTVKFKYGDALVHDNIRYTVLGHKQVGDRYDIITEARQHKSGRR